MSQPSAPGSNVVLRSASADMQRAARKSRDNNGGVESEWTDIPLIPRLFESGIVVIVQDYLKQHGVSFDIIPHVEVGEALGHAHVADIPEESFAKTVLLVADHGYRDVVAILPANRRLDVPALGRVLGGSTLGLATHTDVAVHCPDCQRGVLPPFGSQYNLLTVLDKTLASQDTISFEGNTHKETITVRTEDFIRLESPILAVISNVPVPR